MNSSQGASKETISDPRLLEGLGLVLARRWFDAHEAIEEVWAETEEGEWRECLQVLIQQCVAFEHLRRGNALGAFNVWNKARGKLRKLGECYAGIEIGPWGEAITVFYEQARLADRVKQQLEGGVAAGAKHIGDLPELPPATDWPTPVLSAELAARVTAPS
jgi:predicted metal-dependent hydrolase